MQRIPVLVIFAPTATGKTDALFELFASDGILSGRAKIISADSMQVYRGMDICTAKPSLQERERLEHFLIDIKNPDEQFSAAEFVERADSLCREIYAQGFLPVICGGTGFYIRSFLLGLPQTPEGNEQIRTRLKNEAGVLGAQAMWQKLFSVDKESAQKINPSDLYRILRALEIFEITGKPRKAFAARCVLRSEYDFCTLILRRNRQSLYARIDARVEKMFEQGIEQEVLALAQKYPKDSPGLKAIGCHEFLEGGSTEEIKARIKRNSKKYAKKQYVFMRGIPGARVIDLD